MMPSLTLLAGDCRAVLKTLPERSVDCVVTSPPYWGLRDYGTASWEGGDTEECDHVQKIQKPSDKSTLEKHGHDGRSPQLDALPGIPYRSVCAKCGAKRIDAQIGLEATPEQYVKELVEVFREVHRVLKDDGTLWLNLGDSYSGSWGNYGGKNRGAGSQRAIRNGSQIHKRSDAGTEGWRPPTSGKAGPGLKPKDLVGIPWMTAFALRADGWYLRSDIIWAKPNPMPESVTDRPTKAHEYIFLLSKSQSYHYDAAAIREPCAPSQDGRVREDQIGGNRGDLLHHSPGAVYKKGRTGKTAMRGQGHFREHETGPANRESRDMADVDKNAADQRNKRSVWTVNTQPYPEAHFATFPPDLIKPCILAGCRQGGTVLDPFGGSGTTGAVALELGRSAILIELNADYLELARQRTDVTPGLPL